MAIYNYNRRYVLTIETPAQYVKPELFYKQGLTGDVSSLVTNSSVDFREVVKSNAVEIKDLQIVAEVNNNSKSSGSDAPNSSIRVYNPSSNTLSLLTKPNAKVILQAGYDSDVEDGLPIVFTGQVFNTYTEKVGPDIILHIKCKDGWTPSSTIRVSKEFSGVSYGKIINLLAQEWAKNGVKYTSKTVVTNVPTVLSVSPDSLTPSSGAWSYTGYLYQAMDDITKELGYTWYIVNSTLYVHPKGFKEQNSSVQLSESQIKSIRFSQDNTRTQSTNPESSGIKVRTFLNGRLDSAKGLEIVDGEFKGFYKIVKTQHSLDFRGSSWDTELDCERVELNEAQLKVERLDENSASVVEEESTIVPIQLFKTDEILLEENLPQFNEVTLPYEITEGQVDIFVRVEEEPTVFDFWRFKLKTTSDITISISTNDKTGLSNPSFVGINDGDVIPANSEVIFNLRANNLSGQVVDELSYRFTINETGDYFSVNVLYGSNAAPPLI